MGLTGEVVVEVSNLIKRYGGTVALKGISFKVYRGEIYGLLGPNGAGKTTTIRSIAGAIKPDKGSVFVLGIDSIRNDVEARKHLGIVAELPSLYNELTVWDNLYYVARIHGMGKQVINERVKIVAEQLGLENLLRTRYGRLSKGLKRRADIAAALIHDPEILLLDEPTSGVDPLMASRLRELIKGLAESGKTIILSSHYIEEAMNLSNRVLLLYRGTKVVEGEPEYLARILGLSKEIRIYLARKPSEAELEGLRGKIDWEGLRAEPEFKGDLVVVRTNNVLGFLEEALPRIKGLGLPVRDLEIQPPTWESVFKGYIEPLSTEACKSCPLAAAGCV